VHSFGNIFLRKNESEKRLGSIDQVLLNGLNQQLVDFRHKLWKEYNLIVQAESII